MLGKSSLLGASSSSYDRRIFVYELEGLRQNDPTESNSYTIRKSGRILLQIPYNCMNDEMRRINRLGGKIVSICPLGDDSSDSSDG